jgi:tetratricopeptide (TPR) repeat protein
MKTPRVFPLALLGLALLLTAVPALADDEPPPYGASDLVLEEEGLTDGWEVVYEEVPGTLGERKMEEWIGSVRKSAGVDEDAFLAEIRVLKGPDGAAATLAVVEVDAEATVLAETLEQRGKALGYLVRSLGHPSRVLLIEGPEASRQAVEEMQLHYAVRSLANLGFERLTAGSQVGAIAFARGAQSIQKKAGAPLVLLGMAAAKLEKFQDAIEAFRAGFKDGVPAPATGRLAMRGNAHYGYVLLKSEGKAPAAEAVKALERAVALEEHAEKEDSTFATRQNLARAYLRVGDTDKAFATLEKALEMGKMKLGVAGLMQWIQMQVASADEWKPLLEDARFKGVIQRVTGQSADEDDEGL